MHSGGLHVAAPIEQWDATRVNRDARGCQRLRERTRRGKVINGCFGCCDVVSALAVDPNGEVDLARVTSDNVDGDSSLAGGEQQAAHMARELLSRFPNRVETLVMVSKRLHYAVRAVVLEELQSRLQEQAAPKELETYEQKRLFAAWLNAEMRQSELALRCPKTGKSTFLEVVRGPTPHRGRFRFDHMDSAGRHRLTFSCVELPPLEFMPDPTVRYHGRRRDDGHTR